VLNFNVRSGAGVAARNYYLCTYLAAVSSFADGVHCCHVVKHISRRRSRVQILSGSSGNGCEQRLSTAHGAAINLIAGNWRTAVIRLEPCDEITTGYRLNDGRDHLRRSRDVRLRRVWIKCCEQTPAARLPSY